MGILRDGIVLKVLNLKEQLSAKGIDESKLKEELGVLLVADLQEKQTTEGRAVETILVEKVKHIKYVVGWWGGGDGRRRRWEEEEEEEGMGWWVEGYGMRTRGDNVEGNDDDEGMGWWVEGYGIRTRGDNVEGSDEEEGMMRRRKRGWDDE